MESTATPTPEPVVESTATPTPALVLRSAANPIAESEPGTEGEPTATPTPEPEVEATATPTPVPTYTVTYDVGENTAATAPEARQVAVGAEVPLRTLEHVGSYTFEGWKYGENVVESLIMPDGDVTLVAQWKPVTVTINYRWKGTNIIARHDTYTVKENSDIIIGNEISISPKLGMLYDGYIWCDEIPGEDGAYSFLPVSTASKSITINADSAQNAVTFDCRLFVTVEPVNYNLVYDGTAQSVAVKLSDGGGYAIGGYKADFSNYSYYVGTDVGQYKWNGAYENLDYIEDATGLFSIKGIIFLDSIEIAKRPVNITLGQLTYTADGTTFPKADDVTFTVTGVEGNANSGLVDGHKVIIEKVWYEQTDSKKYFEYTSTSGTYVLYKCHIGIVDQNGRDVLDNYDSSVTNSSKEIILTINKAAPALEHFTVTLPTGAV